MRTLTNGPRIHDLMRALASSADRPLYVYFTGGATAVLLGWRASTVDVNLQLVPELDSVLRALPRIKDELHLNIELVAPSDFISALPGWEARSRLVETIGPVSFHHYDMYSQALAKIERGHAQDRLDVGSMIQAGLIERGELLRWFEAIEGSLYRFPAIDPPSFRRSVEAVTGDTAQRAAR